MPKDFYDVIIIGGGTSGIFAGYELSKLVPGADILILEQGNDVYYRECPIIAGKTPLA